MKNCIDCGKQISDGAKRCNKCANTGKHNPAWQGGKDKEKYKAFDREIRHRIRYRDKFTCQICGAKQVQFKTDKHEIHHINYNKENSVPSNLVALCKSCHIKTNFEREKWTEFFRQLFIKRGIIK